MSNLSILERNINHSFEVYANSEECVDVFLRNIDRKGVLSAEACANDWGQIGSVLDKLLPISQNMFDGADHGVKDYIRTRLEHR